MGTANAGWNTVPTSPCRVNTAIFEHTRCLMTQSNKKKRQKKGRDTKESESRIKMNICFLSLEKRFLSPTGNAFALDFKFMNGVWLPSNFQMYSNNGMIFFLSLPFALAQTKQSTIKRLQNGNIHAKSVNMVSICNIQAFIWRDNDCRIIWHPHIIRYRHFLEFIASVWIFVSIELFETSWQAEEEVRLNESRRIETFI